MDWNPVTHYKDEKIAESYDDERFSRLTGRIFNWLEKFNIKRAFSTVPREGTVLDLPCGTGRLAEVLLEEKFRVVGIDISAAMLSIARKRLQRFSDRFTPQVGDAREIAKTGARFDAALCARVLMHFPLEQQIEFLRGVSDATLGTVVITHSLNSPYQRFRRALKRLLGNPPSAVYPITNSEIKALLKGANLVEKKRLRPMPLVTEEVIIVAEHI